MKNPEYLLQKGADVMEKVEKQHTRNHEEAVQCFLKGACMCVVILLQAARCNPGPEILKLIEEKCVECITEIKKMKDHREKIYGMEGILDKLETMSDGKVLNLLTEIISMCGDYMDFDEE